MRRYNTAITFSKPHDTMRDIAKSLIGLVLVLASLAAGACSHSPYDEMPPDVASFIDMYFDDGTVESVTDTSGGGVVVTIRHGAVVTFDSSGRWTDIDGRGETLPQWLITDQLPQPVVDYLREMELTADVYRLTRSWHYLRVDLAHNYFTYDDQTGKLTYPEAGAEK